MQLQELRMMVRRLAMTQEMDDIFVSVYIDLTQNDWKQDLEAQCKSILKALSQKRKTSFEKSMEQIHGYLKTQISQNTKGVVFFVRQEEPEFHVLQFVVPTVTWISADVLPNLYHLIEMKDKFHRYVIVLSNKENARILEVNMGAVTETIWTEKPELIDRVGREWVKYHYQNHKRHRTQQHFKDKIQILNRLMQQKGHTHLILAGHPEAVNRFEKNLPKNLKDKLVDLVKISDKEPLNVIAQKTLLSFIEHEKKESFSAVETLGQTIAKGGLAACGEEATLKALKNNQVDLLIIDQDYENELAREKMVLMASKLGCKIETVKNNKVLKSMGGVGCLLSYSCPHDELYKQSFDLYDYAREAS